MSETLPRVGVLGGTFDPIHHGHLAAASEVCAALELDQVVFAPTSTQPFKAGMDSASAGHRLAMVHLAVEADERFAVTEVDIDRGGTTYTIDTLSDLNAARPGVQWFFITGADSFARFSEWKDAEALLTMATWVGVTRPGHTLPEGSDIHMTVEVPSIAVSSSDIRRRVRTGSPIRYLVPRSVADYIAQHHLYAGGMDD